VYAVDFGASMGVLPAMPKVGQKKEACGAVKGEREKGVRTKTGKSWQNSLGMFNDSSLVPVIDDEGNRIRQADRTKAGDDPA